MFFVATDDDLTNLPTHPAERFVALFYFTVTTVTSTGYGDIAPTSVRARLVSSAIQLTVMSLLIKRVLESR
jgi:hypothetical protein